MLKKVNLIVSKANIEGFYYKPRFFIEDLLKLNPNEVYITTACVAGILKDEDSIKNIFIPLMQHFGKNLFLEVQNHCEETQITTNKKCLLLSKKFNLKLIAANDSHYIYPEQEIIIPKGNTKLYKVQEGDSINSIEEKTGVNINKIKTPNGEIYLEKDQIIMY